MIDQGLEARQMDLEKIVCSVARIYRNMNKPVLKSKIDSTHEIYADGESELPALTVKINGEPRAKILEIIVFGSVVVIFLSAAMKLRALFHRR